MSRGQSAKSFRIVQGQTEEHWQLAKNAGGGKSESVATKISVSADAVVIGYFAYEDSEKALLLPDVRGERRILVSRRSAGSMGRFQPLS